MGRLEEVKQISKRLGFTEKYDCDLDVGGQELLR